MRLYTDFYSSAPFVRVKNSVQLAEVVGSNFADIAVQNSHGKIIVQCVLDNLIKGAAGTAIQNMNLMFSLKETTGLSNFSPVFP